MMPFPLFRKLFVAVATLSVVTMIVRVLRSH
jgi:hypothetical protein